MTISPGSEPLRLYQVDAFTRNRFTGNPAGVVVGADGLSDAQMQAIARELNNSETAFLLPPRSSDHDVHVRFFTPTTEVPVCGHATIAAHYVRAVEGHITGGTARQLTGAGILTMEVEPRGGNDFRIWMDQRQPEFGSVLDPDRVAAITEALCLTPECLGEGPVQIVSTGHSKVMIPVRSRERLNDARPDLAKLTLLSGIIHCNGYYLFTMDGPASGVTAHGRMFAPAIGISEDPVTGNANGPLGAYLVRYGMVPVSSTSGTFSGWFRQGEALGRPGQVRVIVRTGPDGKPTHVRIGGDAVVAFEASLRV